MAHPYHGHREHQRGHRRVNEILKGHPDGATKHAEGGAFSRVTSKTAAEHHDIKVAGKKGKHRFARGGHVKHSDEAEDRKLIKKMLKEHEKEEGEKYARGGKVKGHKTNIAIVLPGQKPDAGMAGGMPGGSMPMMVPGGAPGAVPPPMPMRACGGKVKKAHGGSIDGESTKADIEKWGKRTSSNSYFRGGAATGVGREEKAEHMRRKRK